MPLIVACPACGKKLKVPDELVGRPVRCADCAGTFTAEAPAPAPPSRTAVAPRSRGADLDDEDDRPARRSSRRRDPDRNYTAHRGGLVLAFGIISIVSSLTGFLVIVGLPLGVCAWIFGGKDMKAIKNGTMDPEGQSMTQIGYILGIIGTILNTLWLIGLCLYIVFVVVIFGLFFGAAASMPTAPVTPRPQPRIPPKSLIQVGHHLNMTDYLPIRMG